jgi:LuxR family transcriptional regulator, maltose regulon positive regulatory protein
MITLAAPRSPPTPAEPTARRGTPPWDSQPVLTKIRAPRLRSRTVDRAHLFERLDPEGGPGLVLVSAPAGYGKTTLLAAWSQTRAQTARPVAWYALDTSDNDPLPFGSYLVASIAQALGPGSGLAAVTQLVRSSPEIDLHRVIPSIINAIAASDRECLLVLDDYHLISSPAIHSALAFLLARRPDNLRVVIGTRSDPPLPLARLRAQGQLAEIRAANLRFTRDETAQFLNEVMELDLAPDAVAALEARTEGWIAGLQLAALSLSGRPDSASLISSVAGGNRYLIQYLLDEVVKRQSDEVQAFLLSTSILERLCAPLCDAILDDHSGSDALLERLEQANLFVVPLDEQAVWYRYHHLFRDFLRTRLYKTRPECVAALHRSASNWFEDQGFLREAVRHALETRDWTYAAEVVERHGMATLMHSEMATVYQWCAAFPEEMFRTHPMLCIIQGWTEVLGYRRDERGRVEERLQMAERAAAALEDKQRGRWLAAQTAVLRTFVGMPPDPAVDPRAQLALAQRALDLLSPGDPLHSTATLAIGYAHMALRDPRTAYAAMDEAHQFAVAEHNYYGAVESLFQQARLAHQQGQLRRAELICQQGQAEIAAALAQPDKELPAIGCLDIALGCVLFEQNRMAEAEPALLRGLDLVGWTINPYYQMTACVALFGLRATQGRSAEAHQFLDRLQEVWPDIGFCVDALRVTHALRTRPEDPEALGAAANWCQAFAASLGDITPLPGMGPLGAAEAYYLALLGWARAQIGVGKPRLALAYLERQLAEAEAHGLWHRTIELSIAQVQAYTALREERRASDALARALDLAEPEGYVRIFDQDPNLVRLLGEAARRGTHREYVGHVLEAIGATPEHVKNAFPSAVPASPVVEALTAREIEVLDLLAAGLLNRDIADRLVVSIGTVKRHTGNIYGKLGVDTRTQAILRARSLGLV